MLLPLIRQLMRYGKLDIMVKNREWMCSLGVIAPDGFVTCSVYANGSNLELVLQDLLIKAKEEYKRAVERIREGRQLDLDIE